MSDQRNSDQFDEDLREIGDTAGNIKDKVNDIKDRLNDYKQNSPKTDLNLKDEPNKSNTISDPKLDNNPAANNGNSPQIEAPNASASSGGADAGIGAGAQVGAPAAEASAAEAGAAGASAAGASAGAAGAGTSAAAGAAAAGAAAAPETFGLSLVPAALIAFGKPLLKAMAVIFALIILLMSATSMVPQILLSSMFDKDGDGNYDDISATEFEDRLNENLDRTYNAVINEAEHLSENAAKNINTDDNNNLESYDFFPDATKVTAIYTYVEELHLRYKYKIAEADEKTIQESGTWDQAFTFIKYRLYESKVSKSFNANKINKSLKNLSVENIENNNIKGIISYRTIFDEVFNQKFKNVNTSERNEIYNDKGTDDDISSAITQLTESLKYRYDGATYFYVPDITNYGSKPLNEKVKSYKSTIYKYCQSYKDKYDPTTLTALVQAVMMQESGGQGGDPMQCSESLGKAPNTLNDPNASIKQGVKYLVQNLSGAKVPKDFSDENKVMLAVQGYNFGSGYVDWVKSCHKGIYSLQNAKSFSMLHANGKEWKIQDENGKLKTVPQYGDVFYARRIMQYFDCSTFIKKGTGSGKLSYPVPSCHTISCGYNGYANHNGIDFSSSNIYGQPVVAADNGTVTVATTIRCNRKLCNKTYHGEGLCSYGRYVVILHNNGTSTFYCHLSSINVKVGQKVSKNQVIGKVGNAGNSSGPHLHFGLQQSGYFLNPTSYFKE